MNASIIADKTTYIILFVAEQFRVYQIAAGTSFERAAREVFSSDSYDACQDYIKELG